MSRFIWIYLCRYEPGSESFTSSLWFGLCLILDRLVHMDPIPWFLDVLLILLIQGVRGLIMRLMVGMVGVRGAIIIEGNGLGHTCLGTRCR